ncbi:MAG: CvpA family protein [Clostridia bacterium]|nr:CvpA family protein [Clostridia bacterium]MBR0444240.1 CvpA family protein [Clostridia bacterium]
MNAIDVGVLLILAIAVLSGFYRGFINAALGAVATVISYVAGFIFLPLVSGAIKGHESLYNMLLYYTEGAEYVAATDVELTRIPISQISSDRLRTIVDNADMPIPMGRRVIQNVASEAFANQGVTTLGDYFNLTIVSVVINIFSLLIIFTVLRVVLAIIIQSIEYGRNGFPSLVRGDGLIGAGIGLIQGLLILFAIFLLMPICLTVLPKLYVFVSESFFGNFFYKANVFLYLIPGH